DSAQTAYALGDVTGDSLKHTEFIGTFGGVTDPGDQYSFKITQSRPVTVTFAGVSADATVQLFDAKHNLIATGTNVGTGKESISAVLSAGTYYVSVTNPTGDTGYTLSLKA